MIPPIPITRNPRQAVPPIIHLIWVGSPPGLAQLGAARRWERYAASLPVPMEVKFWTDSTIQGTHLEAIRHHPITQGMPLRGVADLLRLYTVGYAGGWYFDIDIVPIRPLPAEPTLFSDEDWPGRVASNGAFGLPSGHPLLSGVLSLGVAAYRRGVRNEHFVFGPRIYERAYSALSPEDRPRFDPTLTMRCSAEDRRIQRDGLDFDLDRLRERSPRSTVVHITMWGDR